MSRRLTSQSTPISKVPRRVGSVVRERLAVAGPRRCSGSGGSSAVAVSGGADVSTFGPGSGAEPASMSASAGAASDSASDWGATRHSLAQRAQRSLRGRCSVGIS